MTRRKTLPQLHRAQIPESAANAGSERKIMQLSAVSALNSESLAAKSDGVADYLYRYYDPVTGSGHPGIL